MFNLNSILICTTSPQELAKFYESFLGKPADMSDEAVGMSGWMVGGTYLGILRHSEMTGKAKEPGRVLINFETPQVKEEFERVKGMGAGVVAEPYELMGGWVATLADPDGNYIQLVTPMPM